MEQKKEERNLREMNINLPLVLDSYDDLFSDFDPRPFSQKALSDDFLLECKRASVDKKDGLELKFFVPKRRRDAKKEYEIRKRLKNHFQKHFREKEKEIKSIKREGIVWFFLGAIVMFASTYFYELPGLIYKFLFIITQPAGWFFFWEGLNKIFIRANEKKPDYEFYKKMAKAKIYFFDY